MTVPDPYVSPAPAEPTTSRLLRAAIWVAIGALIAAAIVCVIWVLVGTQNGIVGRAFLTILLLAAFAGVAIFDAHLAVRRPSWFALASMITWVVALLVGAFYIWAPNDSYRFGVSGTWRFVELLLVVLILQLALLHVRLFAKAFQRNVTTFSTIITYVTIALLIILVFMLVFALAFNEWVGFRELYWRFVVALTILVAVGTALVPLTNALFAPKRTPAQAAPYAPPPQHRPTFADGVTPLPVLPDGSPDWNAYYTGYPSTVPQSIAPTPGYAPAPPPQAWPQPEQQGWPAPPTPQQAWPQPPAPDAPAPTPPTPEPPASQPQQPPAYQGFPPPPPLPPQV